MQIITGMKFTAEHPLGLYTDPIKGVIYKDTYEVLDTNKNDCFGDIEIKRLRDGNLSIVEAEWFNQRNINILT